MRDTCQACGQPIPDSTSRATTDDTLTTEGATLDWDDERLYQHLYANLVGRNPFVWGYYDTQDSECLALVEQVDDYKAVEALLVIGDTNSSNPWRSKDWPGLFSVSGSSSRSAQVGKNLWIVFGDGFFGSETAIPSSVSDKALDALRRLPNLVGFDTRSVVVKVPRSVHEVVDLANGINRAASILLDGAKPARA